MLTPSVTAAISQEDAALSAEVHALLLKWGRLLMTGLVLFTFAGVVAGIAGLPKKVYSNEASLAYTPFVNHASSTILNIEFSASQPPTIELASDFLQRYHIEAISPQPVVKRFEPDKTTFLFAEEAVGQPVMILIKPRGVGSQAVSFRVSDQQLVLKQYVTPSVF
jgi:hypothetical protein